MKIAILCGGEGKRLRPYTEKIPKALIPINHKPLLQHILELYLSKKYSDFVLCIGYKGEKIKEFIRKGLATDVPYSVAFSEAGANASMLSRIQKLDGLFEDRIMISYGDTLTNIDIDDFLRFHKSHGTVASIVTTKIQSPFGLVEINKDDAAISFNEKPVFNYYIGHVLLEKRAFKEMDKKLLDLPDGKGLVSFYKKLVKKRDLSVYTFHGQQITFNTHLEKKNAEKMIKSFYTLSENQG